MFWVTLSVHNPRLCDLLQILALSPEDLFPLVFFFWNALQCGQGLEELFLWSLAPFQGFEAGNEA